MCMQTAPRAGHLRKEINFKKNESEVHRKSMHATKRFPIRGNYMKRQNIAA